MTLYQRLAKQAYEIYLSGDKRVARKYWEESKKIFQLSIDARA